LAAGIACGQGMPAPSSRTVAKSALAREQRRRIAAYDSVVHTVNTDSAFKLWHAMLTAPDIRKAQLAMMCEYARLGDRYGNAGAVALRHMLDTLWKRDDPRVVDRMDRRLVGESPGIGRDTCGPPSGPMAPAWLEHWYVPVLPQLPPSPDSARAPRP